MPIHSVCLTLGSNRRPEHYLPRAVSALSRLGTIVCCSQVWQSAAIGAADQPDYCNLSLCLRTRHTAEDLLAFDGPLRQIEAELDRVRDPQFRSAPRTIDVDLTLYDLAAGQFGRKQIPDPDLFERACIAVPLSELDGIHLPPECGVQLSELAQRLRLQQPLELRPDITQDVQAALQLAAAPPTGQPSCP